MNKSILSLSEEELKIICNKYLNSSIKECTCPLFIDEKCAKEYIKKLNQEIDIDFDIELFLKIFRSKFNIALSLNEEEISELSRLAMLFNKSEHSLARLLYLSLEDTIDFKKLYNLCEKEVTYLPEEQNEAKSIDTNTDYGRKINFMNRTSPVKYLSILSDHQKLAPSDVSLLNDLSLKYGLNKGVINVIIEYTLDRLDNNLPRAYCEKLASYLSRKKVKSAMEAINTLYEYRKKDGDR